LARWGCFDGVGDGLGVAADEEGMVGWDRGVDVAGHAVRTATAARHGTSREAPLRIHRGLARIRSTTE